MKLRVGPVFCLLVVAGAAVAACAGSSNGTSENPNNNGGDASGAETFGFDPDATGEKTIVKLTVEPAAKTIEIVNGDVTAPSASQTYSATATYSDGSTGDVGACVWSIDRIELGSFVGSTFKVSGGAGGTGRITCAAYGLTASTDVTVFLRDETDASTGLDATDKKALIASVTGDPTVNKLLYPYDKTVFPRGLGAPELMWTGASSTDVYALRMELPAMSYTSYFKTTSPARASIAKESWTRLLDTAQPKDSLKVTLYRMSGGAGGTAFKSTTQTWSIAAANLKGTIYYWRINGGRVVRLKPGASAPEEFLKTTNGTCVACHSVSHDGSTMVASYEKSGPLPWVTFDVATGAEKYFASGTNSGFQAITPDASMVVAGQTSGTTMQLLQSTTGAAVGSTGIEAFGSTVVHPSFSPDGKNMAFGVRKDGNWVDFLTSDLAIAPFDAATQKFGAMKTLVPSGGGVRTYPSFSPDSKWIAYMEGKKRPGFDMTASSRPAYGDLHLINVDGTGDTVLANANNAGVADVDKSLAFEPNFNPVFSGGYYWVVFVTSRQYGNRINKTYDAFRDVCGSPSWDATPCRNKQLWVTAIDADPKPGVDPSHPAFWLPGQDLHDQNMRAYWALDPCKKLGEGCEAGFECCEGTCKGEGSAPKVCVKPPPGTCRSLGDKCEKSSDCCDAALGVECIGGVCGKKLPS